MAGIEIGDVEVIGADWEPESIVVGHVLTVDPHPNADRLKLPTVNIGNGETATVVCGAPNVAAGQKIAFAREGASPVQSALRQGGDPQARPNQGRRVVWNGLLAARIGDSARTTRAFSSWTTTPLSAPRSGNISATRFWTPRSRPTARTASRSSESRTRSRP